MLYGLQRKTATETAEKIRKYILTFGAPRILQCDNGKVERANQTVENMINGYLIEMRDKPWIESVIEPTFHQELFSLE